MSTIDGGSIQVDAFLGQIMMFAGTFAPAGWALCDGQILPIAQNNALFALIGATYGGDGKVTFALPDLRGRIPIHAGAGEDLTPRKIGAIGGEETHTLIVDEIPAHSHSPLASLAGGNSETPVGGIWSEDQTGTIALFSDATPDVPMDPRILSIDGGNQPHDNMPPFIVLNFCIALQGVYPSPS